MKYPLRVLRSNFFSCGLYTHPGLLTKYGNVLNWLSFLITLDYRLRLSDIRKLLVYSLVPFLDIPGMRNFSSAVVLLSREQDPW